MEREAVKEEVHYQHPSLCYKIWGFHLEPEHRNMWNRWHYHKEVEILLLQEGFMQVETVDRLYHLREQDLFVAGSSRLHRTKRLTPVNQVVLQFDMMAQLDMFTNPFTPALLEISKPLDHINRILATERSVKESMRKLILQILNEASKKQQGFEVAISGAIKQLLALFIRHAPVSEPFSHVDWNRLKPVLDYIELHYTKPIRIPEVLQLVHLEYHYFIKYFQKCIGMSFVDYLHFKRIKKSEHLLLTESLSIAEIGIESGFPNTSQFIRIFKRYNGCTPSDFRKIRMQNQVHSE